MNNWHKLGLAGLILMLAGCASSTTPVPRTADTPATVTPARAPSQEVNFAAIVRRVEPVAEETCRRSGAVAQCDYRIVVDTRPGVPANAFQTVDKTGRPLLIVTQPLLEETRNADEVAFILGHEAAHHIRGHLTRTSNTAVLGAILAGTIVAAGGGDLASVEAAQDLGALAGSRAFSKNYELEADALGTVIAYQAGYDPVRGSAYFARIPDPGNQFLGTHPPNADRQRVVRQVAAGLN
ncbi:M48 family metalloprotease [Fluviibacterium sp. S390]|uniref:M48 family metalloprotease n=1 Tax=Fluviibacterium sp. S390 TaxID=3415139 RepID=UPI003C7CB19C